MRLADLVVSDWPAAFETWADGPIGADLAIPGRPGQVLNSIDPELLEVLDFTAGYLRFWTSGEANISSEDPEIGLGVVAMEFADVDGAGGLIDAQASLMTLFPDLETFSPAPGFALEGLVLRGESGYVASCLFAIERFALWVFAQAADREGAVELVMVVAPAQVALAERLLRAPK